MADMTGNDMVMPMVKVTLPIFRRKTNAMRRSAQLGKEAAEYDRQRRQDMLHSEYLSIAQRAADELRKLALYDKQNAILDNTLKLMQAEYATGASSLTDILVTTRQEIDYALQRAEAKARYNTVVAEYEKLASKYGPAAHP
jgi:outer membrane protein TolC